MDATVDNRRTDGRCTRQRTCAGCGLRDDASALARIVAVGGGVAFDLAGGAFGRGAHVHARPACLEKAPRGVARAVRDARAGAVGGAGLGRLLLDASDRRIAGLLGVARRLGAVAVGLPAAVDAVERGAPLAVVAVDAPATIASSAPVGAWAARGGAIAWGTKIRLGALLGEREVAICAVRHVKIAGELKRMRAAADAGAAAAREEGAGCSRFPEAR